MLRERLSLALTFLMAPALFAGCAAEGDGTDLFGSADGGVITGGGTPGGAGTGGTTAGTNPGIGGTGGTTAGPGGTTSGGGTLSGTTSGGSGTPGGTISGGTTSGTGGATPGGTTGGSQAGIGGATPGGTTGGSPGGTGGATPGGTTGGSPGGSTGGSPGGGTTGGGTTGGGTTGGGGTAGGGMNPTLPPISGTCPEFKNGTVMVAGHGGVMLQVGSPNKNGSLLFYWHGTGSSASEVNGGFIGGVPASVRNEILSNGGIIASFDGGRSSGAEGDCSGTGAHNMADFKAADQIAACAVKNFGIDPRRIYTTGCSAGGLQSGCMAQVRSSYLAAAAPNSGGVVFPQKWQDASKPAIFTMHGGSSDWVIVTFSETSATLDMNAKQHGSFVVNCDHGGGHCAAPDDLKVAAWKFMKDHPYGAQSPWKAGIPSGVPSYCKIY